MSLGNALKKAGIDTVTNELKLVAAKLLNDNKLDPARTLAGFARRVRARDELLGALLLNYLKQTANDLGGPLRHDTQVDIAAKPTAAGHSRSDTQERGARGSPPSPLVKSLTPVVLSRALQKEEREDRRMSYRVIYNRRKIGGKPIGDIWYEDIPAILKERTATVASVMRSMNQETADALLLYEIYKRFPSAKNVQIRNLVPADALEKLNKETYDWTPATINIVTTTAATTFEQLLERERNLGPRSG